MFLGHLSVHAVLLKAESKTVTLSIRFIILKVKHNLTVIAYKRYWSAVRFNKKRYCCG
ncbi:hypothetical protein C0J52_01411 [Blattella germanica]|nr:hypothetical protein C0J52_01411 [Blattella germanica]